MAIVKEDRPNREPDVILPEVADFSKVEVWIEEKRFAFRGTLHDSVASKQLDIDVTSDPVVYLKAVISAYESGHNSIRERAEAATGYFLEQEIFSEEV